jgi:hypothetical protein
MTKKRPPFMGREKGLFLFALLGLCSLFSFAQQTITVTGKVTSESQPLYGVSVTVKGATSGTTTDEQGNYSISTSGNADLVFTFVGFTTQTIKVNNRRTINVELAADTKALEDVVVIGYGTTRKSDLTGAVGTVSEAKLKERSVSSLSQSLAGKVTGVQVNSNSGRPGGRTNIRIRGFSSINSSNNPLYVIDGVMMPINNQTPARLLTTLTPAISYR